MKQVYNQSIKNGMTYKHILYTKDGLEILDWAFNFKRWNDKTIPKYIKDLFPYVIKIGNGSFFNSKLTTLTLPNVKSIGNRAFYNSPLITLNIKNIEYIHYAVFISSKLTTLNIPLVKKIGSWAFKNSKLTKLNLPLVKTIGENTFKNSKLKHWYVGTNIQIKNYLNALKLV